MKCPNCGETIIIPAGKSEGDHTCAVQERETAQVDVCEQAVDGEEVGGGDEET